MKKISKLGSLSSIENFGYLQLIVIIIMCWGFVSWWPRKIAYTLNRGFIYFFIWKTPQGNRKGLLKLFIKIHIKIYNEFYTKCNLKYLLHLII